MSDASNTKMDVPTLTERDVEILVGAIRSTEGGLAKPDMKKFAEVAGFKNTNSASVSLSAVKKKIMGEAAPVKTPKKASTPSAKRKVPTPKEGGDEDIDDTPTKKPKPTPKKLAKKDSAPKAEPAQGGEDDSAAFV